MIQIGMEQKKESKAPGVMKWFLPFCILTLLPLSVMAQADRQHIRQGNRLFRQGDFANAEVSYRKAIEANSRNSQAQYNLGNALLAQGKDSAAVTQFEQAANLETNPLRKSKSFHNMGWICQRRQLYDEAIEAYKQSLRLNPTDDETRYNLALCKYLRQQQQQNQQNQDQKQKDNKDKQDKQQQQKEKKDEQKPKQEDSKMSKENAEQLLNAAMQNEKRTLQRMKDAQKTPQRRQLDKNW